MVMTGTDVVEMTIIDDSERQDGRDDGWHATVGLCDPNTKLPIRTLWHGVFPTESEAEQTGQEMVRRLCSPSWGWLSIGYATVCRACRVN